MSTPKKARAKARAARPTAPTFDPAPTARLQADVVGALARLFVESRARQLDAGRRDEGDDMGFYHAPDRDGQARRHVGIVGALDDARGDLERRLVEAVGLVVPGPDDDPKAVITPDGLLVVVFPSREVSGASHECESLLVATCAASALVDLRGPAGGRASS